MTDIVTITINPAVDIFVNVPRIEPTRKLRCSAPKRDPGGGGINVARVANRMGADVIAIYPTGGAIGNLLHRLVEREGITSIVTPSHVETRENFTAYEESTGEQYRFVLPGSPLYRVEWEACLDKLNSLPKKPKIVVASGSIPPGVPEDFFARVARSAKDMGAQMILDTSGPGLKATLTEGVTLIKPNQVELSELAGAPLDHPSDFIAAARRIITDKRVEAVALTCGADGAMLITATAALQASLNVDIEVVSTVGAGDSFLGGFVATLASGKSFDAAFKVAVAAGSAAVTSPGTELCRKDDVARLLPHVQIKEVAHTSA
jgi:6-phosphofructokinase 2